MRKVIKYSIIFVSSLAIALVTAVLVIYFYYADQIIRYTIEQLNKNLTGKVEVQKVSLDLLTDFPYAAIAMSNTRVISTIPKEDTLLLAEKLLLQLNWIKIINKQYLIEGVGIINGRINLSFDSSGNFVHQLYKEEQASSNESSTFAIRRIWVKQSLVNINWQEKKLMATHLNEFHFAGEINEEKIAGELAIQGTNLTVWWEQKQHHIQNYKIVTDCFNDDKKTSIEGKIQVNQQNFFVSFSSDDAIQNFEIKGNKINWKKLASLLPEDLFKQIPEPKCNLSAQIRRQKAGSKEIFVKAQATFRNLETILPKKIVAKASGTIRYEGKLMEKFHQVNLSEIQLKTNYSQSNFSGIIMGTKQKWMVNANGNSSIDVREFSQIMDSLPLQLKVGTANLKFSIKKHATTLDNLFTKKGWIYELDGKAENMAGYLNKMRIDSVTTTLSANPNIIHIYQLTGNWENFPIQFNGTVSLESHPVIEGKLIANNLNIDKALMLINSDKSSSTSPTLSLDLSIKSGSFKELPFNQLRTTLYMKDSLLQISDFSVTYLNGNTNMSLKKIGFSYNIAAQLKNVDAALLVQLLEHFGFSQIKKEMIAGKINAKGQFQGTEINNKIQFNNILGNFELTINEGRLIQYPPVKDIMKYINIREPEDIRFKPIKIQLNIQDNTLWFAPTRIQSSAIDFMVWGNHTFDNRYDYHFKFYLADILKRKRENNSSIPVNEVEDSTKMSVVFIQLAGSGTSYKISYDTKASLTNFRSRWQEEQKTLRNIIKDEFKPSDKSDNTELMNTHNKKAAPTVIIEDQETKPDKRPANTTPSKKKPSIEWKDEDN